jgi:hypothetical protein
MSIRRAFEKIHVGPVSEPIEKLRSAHGTIHEHYVEVDLFRIKDKRYRARGRDGSPHGAFRINVNVRQDRLMPVVGVDSRDFVDQGQAEERFNALLKEYVLREDKVVLEDLTPGVSKAKIDVEDDSLSRKP